MRSTTGCLLVLMLAGCVGPTETVKPGGVRQVYAAAIGALPEGEARDEPDGPRLGDVTERQHESECRLAAEQIWRALEPVASVGADVEHIYWANRGALTLVSWKRSEGGEQGSAVDGDRSIRALWPVLCRYVPKEAGYLRLLHRRTSNGWELHNVRVESGMAPPEAKTLPVDAPQIAAGTFAVLEREVRGRWWPLLRAPAHGTKRLELKVDLEDERLVSTSLLRQNGEGRGEEIGAPPGFETQIAGALVPFTQGLWKRSVRVVLETVREPGEEKPRWRVTMAETMRPKGSEPEAPYTTFTEFRLLHEEIMRRWRQEARDTAVFAATFTAEQTAIWVAGGWAAKGLGAALRLGSGPLLRVLGRGGPEAADWLYWLLRRTPNMEREALARLLAKLETGSVEALTAVEKKEMRAIFQKLEQLATTPLTQAEADSFRATAAERFWVDFEQQNAELAKQLVYQRRTDILRYPVHHKFVLEYAHLDPERNANALSELVAIAPDVHHKINGTWNRLRPLKTKVTLEDVKRLMHIIDKHYGRWYNTTYSKSLETQLQVTEQSVITEANALFIEIKSR